MLEQKEPIKAQIFRLLCTLMKVHPIPHASFETYKVDVYSNFASLFNVMKGNSPVFFLAQTFILWTRRTCQSEIFRLLSRWVKINQIAYVMFKITCQFFFKLYITLHCHER